MSKKNLSSMYTLAQIVYDCSFKRGLALFIVQHFVSIFVYLFNVSEISLAVLKVDLTWGRKI